MRRRHFIATGLAAAATAGVRAEGPAGPLRVAVIGHTGRGDFGHELDTLWLGLPGCKVVAIADPVEAGRTRAAARLGGVPAFADFREMLEKVRPDVVSIAPRHIDQRLEMITAAIGSGARGLYVEKPFAPTPSAADEIIGRARKAGARIAIAHRMRAHPVLPLLKKSLADGLIGTVLEIRGRGKEDHRGGLLDTWVLGSHVFNLIHYLAGRALHCQGVVLDGLKPVTPDQLAPGPEGVGPIAGNRVHARFLMENGLTAHFDSIKGAGTPAAGFGLQIIGTEGTIDLRVDREPFVHLRRGSPFETNAAPVGWLPFTTAGPGKPEPIADLGRQIMSHQRLAGDLLAAIRENREPVCDGTQGHHTVEMIHAIMASQRAGGATVSLPLTERSHAFAGWR